MQQYALFEPLPEDVARKEELQSQTRQKRADKMKEIIIKYKLINLNHDYLMPASFYIQPVYGYIWQYNPSVPMYNGRILDTNAIVALEKLPHDIYDHVCKYNNIPVNEINYNQQPNILY